MERECLPTPLPLADNLIRPNQNQCQIPINATLRLNALNSETLVSRGGSIQRDILLGYLGGYLDICLNGLCFENEHRGISYSAIRSWRKFHEKLNSNHLETIIDSSRDEQCIV